MLAGFCSIEFAKDALKGQGLSFRSITPCTFAACAWTKPLEIPGYETKFRDFSPPHTNFLVNPIGGDTYPIYWKNAYFGNFTFFQGRMSVGDLSLHQIYFDLVYPLPGGHVELLSDINYNLSITTQSFQQFSFEGLLSHVVLFGSSGTSITILFTGYRIEL